MKIRYLLLFSVVVTSSNASNSFNEKEILGVWCAGSSNSFHEYFELSIEDEEHDFSSWIHDHPAISGTWELHDSTLTINGRSDMKFVYTVINASPTKLTVQEEGEEPEIYVRDNCYSFGAPPTE